MFGVWRWAWIASLVLGAPACSLVSDFRGLDDGLPGPGGHAGADGGAGGSGGGGGAGGVPACKNAVELCTDKSECCGNLACGMTSAGQVCCGLMGEVCMTQLGEDCCGTSNCVDGHCT